MKRLEAVLGENVRRLRRLAGKSQSQIGKESDLSQKTVSNMEQDGEMGSPKLDSVGGIARYFRVHPALLLIDNLPDEALKDQRVSEMLAAFARLDHDYQAKVMDLIEDYSKLSSEPRER